MWRRSKFSSGRTPADSKERCGASATARNGSLRRTCCSDGLRQRGNSDSSTASRPGAASVSPVMGLRMGRLGGVGNGTAVMAPRTIPSPRRLDCRSRAFVRPVARHHKDPLPHFFDLRPGSPGRWGQRPRVPSDGALAHRPGRALTDGNRRLTRAGRAIRDACARPARDFRPASCAHWPYSPMRSITEAHTKIADAPCSAIPVWILPRDGLPSGPTAVN